MVPSWAPAVGFSLVPHIGGFCTATVAGREDVKTWYATLKKPSLSPPNCMFGPVWTALYTSMGYGSYLLWKEVGGFNEDALVPLGLYAGQLALNWAWSPLFFCAHKIGWAAVESVFLTGTVFATTVSWYSMNKTAAYCMFPYLVWMTLASALNYCLYCLWRDNKDKQD